MLWISSCSWIKTLIYDIYVCFDKNFHITSQKQFPSLGYSPVKTICSMSCPVSISRHFQQHPFCTLFRKHYTNSKWNLLNDFLYLMPVILLSGFQQRTRLTLTSHFCCLYESPLRIMSVSALCIVQFAIVYPRC